MGGPEAPQGRPASLLLDPGASPRRKEIRPLLALLWPQTRRLGPQPALSRPLSQRHQQRRVQRWAPQARLSLWPLRCCVKVPGTVVYVCVR